MVACQNPSCTNHAQAVVVDRATSGTASRRPRTSGTAILRPHARDSASPCRALAAPLSLPVRLHPFSSLVRNLHSRQACFDQPNLFCHGLDRRIICLAASKWLNQIGSAFQQKGNSIDE